MNNFNIFKITGMHEEIPCFYFKFQLRCLIGNYTQFQYERTKIPLNE